jgi:serine/threonine protein phosphatase PrpC
VLASERLQEVAGKLVDAANARGGRDNVSVVLASVGWADPENRAEKGPTREKAGAARRARRRTGA